MLTPNLHPTLQRPHFNLTWIPHPHFLPHNQTHNQLMFLQIKISIISLLRVITPETTTFLLPINLPRSIFQNSRVNKYEKYFQLNLTLDARTKVVYATLYLEEEADVWYRSQVEVNPFLLWFEFVELICNHFLKVGYENLVGQFTK